MKHFNFSNAEQWWQYWDQLMKCWETNSVLFTTLSTQWKVHNIAPPCGVISYTSRSVICKTAAISQLICGQKCLSSTAGFEPAIFWSVVRRVIRCATRPMVSGEDTFCSMHQELDPGICLCWGFHHNKSFLSVVVITCPSHGQGRRFDPGREQGDTPFGPAKVGFPCVCEETG